MAFSPVIPDVSFLGHEWQELADTGSLSKSEAVIRVLEWLLRTSSSWRQAYVIDYRVSPGTVIVRMAPRGNERTASLAIGPKPAIVKTENPRNAVLVVLHCPFRRARPLKWRNGSAILKPLSVSIVLTQPSCRLVIQPCMMSSSPGLALRSLPALEVIGSDSDLVAQAT
jgi:hypothetical protein